MRAIIAILGMLGASPAWGAFADQRTLTVTSDAALLPSTQSDFPLLISVTDNALRTVANGGKVQSASGYDICFFADAARTTPLKWEMESYNGASGTVVAWVRIPTLDRGRQIYMAYGDPAISTFQSTASAVWDSNYAGVYHFGNGSTLSVSDSTANAKHGTKVNNPTAGAGKIGGAVSMVAANSQTISLGDTPPSPTAITFEAWMKFNSTAPAGYMTLAGKDGSRYGLRPQFLQTFGLIDTTNTTVRYDAGTSVAANSWYHFVLTYNPTNGLIGYLNGVVDRNAAANGALIAGSAITYIGSNGGANGFWDGLIDEMRFSSVTRSADWIKASYNNQNAPGAFVTIGAESGGTGAARVRVIN